MIKRKRIDQKYLIEEKEVIVRREDLAYPDDYPRSGKVAALEAIIDKLALKNVRHVSMFAKEATNYAPALALLCEERAMASTVFFAANSLEKAPQWLLNLRSETITEVKLLRPNMITINVNQAKKLSQEQGAYFIPFGLDCETAVDAFSKTLTFPKTTETLLLSTCSGITLAGFIRGLRLHKQKIPRIIAVSCGRSVKQIKASIEKYEKLPATLEIVDSYQMHEDLSHVKTLWDCSIEYELKLYDWMMKNIGSLKGETRFLNLGV